MTTKTEAAARYREVAGQAAYPVTEIYHPVMEQVVYPSETGLTKREHFAGLAMQGLLASGITQRMYSKDVITMCIRTADALIAALEESK